MAEEHPDRDASLAVRRELGPVAGDRSIEIEPTLPDELVGADREDALGHGEDDGRRVLHPRSAVSLVRDAAPQIDDLSSADVENDRGTAFPALCEVRAEGVGDGSESRPPLPRGSPSPSVTPIAVGV